MDSELFLHLYLWKFCFIITPESIRTGTDSSHCIKWNLKKEGIPLEQKRIPGELAVLLIIVINSLGVTFMTKSGFGISSISSVPYVVSNAFPILTFGTWNYLFQTSLVVLLMVLSRKIQPMYLVSFVVGVGFGKMIDVHEAWVMALPDGLAFQVLYFSLGFLLIGFGICIGNLSGMPIIPTDTFPRDFAALMGIGYGKVKTVFDVLCLITTAVLSLTVLGHLLGIGIGTVLCAFTMGKYISLLRPHVEKRVCFYPGTKAALQAWKHTFSPLHPSR